MKPTVIFFGLLTIAALVGCQSKQAKLVDIQAQYKPLSKHYYNDCIAPSYGTGDSYLKGTKPKVATPQEEAAHNQKCAQERQQVTALEQQMQALQK